jgi:tRNA G37 N-methylase Trm5
MATKSFESVGHIAHMNIREKWAPYKHIIGA